MRGKCRDHEPGRRLEPIRRYAGPTRQLGEQFVRLILVEGKACAGQLRCLFDDPLQEANDLLYRLHRVFEALRRNRKIADTQIYARSLLGHTFPRRRSC